MTAKKDTNFESAPFPFVGLGEAPVVVPVVVTPALPELVLPAGLEVVVEAGVAPVVVAGGGGEPDVEPAAVAAPVVVAIPVVVPAPVVVPVAVVVVPLGTPVAVAEAVAVPVEVVAAPVDEAPAQPASTLLISVGPAWKPSVVEVPFVQIVPI